MNRFLYYHGQINLVGVRNVEALVLAAHREGINSVTLCIASEGGDVNSGIGLYNFLQMMPITINTHASGMCSSIAATVLIAGVKRTASPVSSFTVHAATYTSGLMAGQKAPDSALVSQPFADRLGWSAADIDLRFGSAEFRITPTEAIGLGMISEITDLKLGPDDDMLTVMVP